MMMMLLIIFRIFLNTTILKEMPTVWLAVSTAQNIKVWQIWSLICLANGRNTVGLEESLLQEREISIHLQPCSWSRRSFRKRLPHTFDDWGLAIERWVERLPPGFLQYVQLWIQIKNILVNHYTKVAISDRGGLIGHVIEVAFDPDKP